MRGKKPFVNQNEAKSILLLYRPGLADAEDPQIAEALRLAEQDTDLGRWLAEHSARQESLRGKFRRLTAPAGLKEQIISEQAALGRRQYWLPRLALTVAVILLMPLLAYFRFPRHPADDNLAMFQNQMVRDAQPGYYMDLNTTNLEEIQVFLAGSQAPAKYVLPVGLARAAVSGCAVIGWQDAKVSMLCFRSGRPQPPGQGPDLWLFVADRASIPDAPEPGQPRIGAVNRLLTATWTQGDKVYLLGLQGDEVSLRKFL